MTDKKADIEAIAPDEKIVVVNGIDCRVKRFRTREFLSLSSIITTGLGAANAAKISFSGDDDEMVGQLLGVVMIALPNAIPEFIQFLNGIVEPVDKTQAGEVYAYLKDNPDLGEMVDIFEAFAEQEHDEIGQLTGKVRAAWERLGALYRPKTAKANG